MALKCPETGRSVHVGNYRDVHELRGIVPLLAAWHYMGKDMEVMDAGLSLSPT